MATTYTDATMGARAIGARTDSAGTAVTDVSAEEDRYSQIILTEGWVKPSDSLEPVAGAAATMNVVVGSGSAKADYYVVAGDTAGQGNYLVRLAGATVTVALNAAHGSLPRIDEIYLVVLDNAYDSTGLALPRFAYRDGTAAASPAVPGPDAGWDAYVLLATIDVPAAAADIEACTITDERLASTVDVGGTVLRTAVVGVIEPDDAAAEGVATSLARSDHQHAIGAATAVSVGATNSEGSSTSFARADHVHEITDAEAVAVVADGAVDTSAEAFTATMTDAQTLTFTMPTGWAAATITAWGSVNGRPLTGPGGSGTTISARIVIAGTNGTTITSVMLGDYPAPTLTPAFSSSVSSSCDIDLQISSTGAIQLGTQWTSLLYIAVRTG